MGLGAGFKLKDPKDKEREKDNIKLKGEKHKSKHKDKEKVDDDTPPYDVYAPSGWTSILEDWLCNGGGCTTSTNDPDASSSSAFSSPKHLSTGNLPDRVAAKEQWKGLYHPVIKHRMMGLYLTVYVHRAIRGLVRGDLNHRLCYVTLLIAWSRDFEVCRDGWVNRGSCGEQR